MPGKQRDLNQRHQFAVAMAMGQSLSGWAKQNGVPRRTCYDWRKTEEYKVTVEDARRRTVDRAVGQFVRNLTKAVDPMLNVMRVAESESVQLHAARAVVEHLMKVRQHGDLEERMVQIESQLEGANTHVP
jgi:hypothetical protein